jgi:hypothetical protein
MAANINKSRMTRHEKRLAKPCRRHKGHGEVDGTKTKKSALWFEGAPMKEVLQGGKLVTVSTRYSSK